MTRPLVLAHRGANRQAPENTVEAFARALELGADGVELDVHRTADAGLVVHHDAEAGGLGVLADRSLEEIREASPAVPTLEEALDVCSGAIVNIEIKNLPGDADFDPAESAAGLVVALLAARGHRDEVVISSFNLGTIDRVHELDPTLATALLAMVGFDPYDALEVCAGRGHGGLHPFVGMLAGPSAEAVTKRAHEVGVRVNAWTVNDDDEMGRLADAGVDGIITDVPDEALARLTERPV